MFELKPIWTIIYKNKIVSASVVVLLLACLIILFAPPGKYSYEKTQQQIGALANAVRTYYARQPHYWGLSNKTALQKNLAPKNLLRNNKIMCALGRELLIGSDSKGSPVSPGGREFMISIPDLGQKSCKQLVLIPLSENISLGLLKIVIENNSVQHTFEWGGGNPLPIQAQAAQNACAKQNIISFVFE